LDSEYLQDIIKQYSNDIKNDDKEYAKILNWLRDRLNQQYPGNQNVSKTDLVKLLKEPAIKRDVKKLNNIKITDIVNDLFTM
jgi:ubiquitin C-terminal hydrolase